MKPKKILMLGRELNLAWQIENHLTRKGPYIVYVVRDEDSVVRAVASIKPELLLVDMDLSPLDCCPLLESYAGATEGRQPSLMLISGTVPRDRCLTTGKGGNYPVLTKHKGADKLADSIHERLAV